MAETLPCGKSLAVEEERVARLILTGQVLQALADASPDGHDAPEAAALHAMLSALAQDIAASWRGERRSAAAPAPPPLNGRIMAREPEGYAFYCVYPELYYEAARRLSPRPHAAVVGLRSIGASLAPMVAAGLGAPRFHTVRPKGHVFAREIDAPAGVATSRLLAVVDEGPGLSGSSFAAAARLAGNTPDGLHFFPSHPHGPGSEATPETRALFARARTHFVSFDDAILNEGRLARWIEDLVGPTLRMDELSGGEWRRRFWADEQDWPAVDAGQERRKFLVETERGRFLVKFVGVGDIGARKGALARRLAAGGWTPEALGVRHGFLVERWLDDARPVDLRRDREALIATSAAYLAFRHTHLAGARAGADVGALRAMVARNVGLLLGEAAAATAVSKLGALRDERLRPIVTDNRMQAHEWLRRADGRIVKTDAVDHHAGHDLMGPQDAAYDVAAAEIEFELDAEESRRFRASVAAPLAGDLVAAYRVVWLAFETGRLFLARDAAGDPDERRRLEARVRFQTQRLARELAVPA